MSSAHWEARRIGGSRALPADAKRWMMIGQSNGQRLTQRVKQAEISVQ